MGSSSTGVAEYDGSSIVGQFGDYTFNFTLINTIKATPVTHTDFIKIIFPRDLFNKEGDVRVPSCSLGTLFVMGVDYTIYLEPTADLSGAISLDLKNMENP